MEYSNLEQEAERHNEAEDPAEDWPPHGTIRAQLCYAHHPSLPMVLRDVNFSIKAHEKVTREKYFFFRMKRPNTTHSKLQLTICHGSLAASRHFQITKFDVR